jgi:hypothetical protein
MRQVSFPADADAVVLFKDVAFESVKDFNHHQ